MEEDIKVLEELIEHNYLEDVSYLREDNDYKKFNQAIENLIKGYREYEKEIEILREYIIIAPNLDEMTALKYAHIQESAYFRGRAEEQQRANETIHKHFIPKSKIDDKIEKYEEMGKATYTDLTHYGDLRRDTILEVLQVLQELKEDK